MLIRVIEDNQKVMKMSEICELAAELLQITEHVDYYVAVIPVTVAVDRFLAVACYLENLCDKQAKQQQEYHFKLFSQTGARSLLSHALAPMMGIRSATRNIVHNKLVAEFEAGIAHSSFPLIFGPQEISRKEIYTLAGLSEESWVDDSIVNSFLRLLCLTSLCSSCVSIPSTVFTLLMEKPNEGYASSRAVNVDIVFQPIVDDHHWVLAVYEKKHMTVTIYDSMNRKSNSKYATLFRNRLEQLKVRVSRLICSQDVISFPQQPNGDDCGIFVMMFAYCIANKLDIHAIDFSVAEIRNFRLKIANCLLLKTL